VLFLQRRRALIREIEPAAERTTLDRTQASTETHAQAQAQELAARGQRCGSVACRMISRKVPSSRELLPVIGLGTWQTFDIEHGSAEQETLAEVLQTFADLGGRLGDSSSMYDRSETVVGEISSALSLQPPLFLATTVWTSGKRGGIRQMEESAKKLRARRVDLMQVHNLVDVSTQLETLCEWKEQGRIRYFGITHYSTAGHDELRERIAAESV
jgi:diketogulonate reductase-like aldo/keto reductase